MQQYLLDSNVFIQAHRLYYPFDVVPGFWTKLIELSERKLILSIDKVRKELIHSRESPDQLAVWCQDYLEGEFFADTTSCVDVYGKIVNWANSKDDRFTQGAIAEFLETDLADPWLVAFAKKNNCVIVTHEIYEPQRRNRIKIPDVCMDFDVRYITTIELFRELQVRI